jgi:diguanylate cyclase (GGDEF)-like protein
LQFVARALQSACRAGDIVGRYGGEEFCVLLKHADHAATQTFDKRLRERLAGLAPQELQFAVSYSAGVAMRCGPADTLEAMLKRADTTLYRAKREGRARTLDEQPLRLKTA